MKTKTKFARGIGLGSGIGALVFPLLSGGEVDWQRSVFMAAVAVVVFLALPQRLINRMTPKAKHGPVQPGETLGEN